MGAEVWRQAGRAGPQDGQMDKASSFRLSLNGHRRNEVAAPCLSQDAESVNENSL